MTVVSRPASSLGGRGGYGAIQAKRALITVRDRGMLCDLAGSSYGPAEATYERLFRNGPIRRSYVASAGP
jgi:hypothetical protein